jgi:DNA (cytosine-5)-methyltransferase 1
MKTFADRVEPVLLPHAKPFTPLGSDSRAVIYQWLNAIVEGQPLFGKHQGVDKLDIVKLLRESGIYNEKDELKEELNRSVNFIPVPNPKFNFIDLFSGIGGFRIALQNLGGTSVFSSEWDKGAQDTYFRNFGEFPFGDITSFTSDTYSTKDLDHMIPDHDILAAGFPCQPFSHAGVSARVSVGKAHGFLCKTQGTLFFDVMKIASIKRPKVLFLENVRNIERHDNGNTFRVIRESINELGYDFEYAIINSSSLVPQRRIRCYMVCFRKDLGVNFKFPEFKGDPLPLRGILEPNPDEKYTISERLWLGHINRTQRNLKRGTGFTAFEADLDKPANTLVARYGKDGKECLIPQPGKKTPRLLTLKECARLQGFPESFEPAKSKTPAYRQFGNSVAIPVVEKIARKIVEDLK